MYNYIHSIKQDVACDIFPNHFNPCVSISFIFFTILHLYIFHIINSIMVLDCRLALSTLISLK
jgi:hypothetical protein